MVDLKKHGQNVIKAMEEINISLQQIEQKDIIYDSICRHVFDCLNSIINCNFRECFFHVKADILCRKREYVMHNDKMTIKDNNEQYKYVL